MTSTPAYELTCIDEEENVSLTAEPRYEHQEKRLATNLDTRWGSFFNSMYPADSIVYHSSAFITNTPYHRTNRDQYHINNTRQATLSIMKTSLTLLGLTTFLNSVFAFPVLLITTSTPNSWRISNFSEGCSPGGCVYHFNIASPATHSSLNEPVFSTVCHGTNVANKMQPCDDPAVTVDDFPGQGAFTLVVEHQWRNKKGVTYFVRGNQTVEIGGISEGILGPGNAG
ncbi:hypothetical protein WAI453_004240 [Rhynchosporium graminicola]